MRKAIIGMLIVFGINIPSLYYGWYLKLDWFDMALHFSGGFFTGMLMYYYLIEHLRDGAIIKNLLIVVGATVFIGVVWEFAEYIANQTLVDPLYKYYGIRAYFMGDIDDTISDLILDMLGGLVFLGLHSLQKRKI